MDDKIEAWRHGLLRLVLQHARAYADNSDPAKTEAAYVAICDYLRTTPEGFVLVPIEWTDEQQTSAQEMLNVLRGALGENLSDETMIGAIYDGMTAPFRKLAASQESWT